MLQIIYQSNCHSLSFQTPHLRPLCAMPVSRYKPKTLLGYFGTQCRIMKINPFLSARGGLRNRYLTCCSSCCCCCQYTSQKWSLEPFFRLCYEVQSCSTCLIRSIRWFCIVKVPIDSTPGTSKVAKMCKWDFTDLTKNLCAI